MSDNKHDICEVFIKSANKFKLLVMHIPNDEVDDYLTYFTRERGAIRKSLFDDWLMSKCVANISEFVAYLENKKVTSDKINIMRAEIVKAIIKHNPKLDPMNIVINHNGVVKQTYSTMTNAIPLTENELWKEDLYKDGGKAFFPLYQK